MATGAVGRSRAHAYCSVLVHLQLDGCASGEDEIVGKRGRAGDITEDGVARTSRDRVACTVTDEDVVGSSRDEHSCPLTDRGVASACRGIEGSPTDGGIRIRGRSRSKSCGSDSSVVGPCGDSISDVITNEDVGRTRG